MVVRIAEAAGKPMQAAEFREQVTALRGEIAAYGPARSDRFMRDQAEVRGRAVRPANIKADSRLAEVAQVVARSTRRHDGAAA